MDFLKKKKESTSSRFGLLYVVNFIVSFHLFFILYFNSSYLNTHGFGEKEISAIYVFGSFLSIVGLMLFSKLLQVFGNYRIILTLVMLELLALSTLAFSPSVYVTALAFLGYLFLYPLILLSLDVFLESVTVHEETTGSIRGTFLTVTNAALIIAPMSAGLLLGSDGFGHMYLIAASFLIPVLVITSWYFKGFADAEYRGINIQRALCEFRTQKSLRNIFIAHFALRLFYAFMVIYTPLYLHNTIGFSLSEIGVMFAIMLLPFALFEIPLGIIADKWLGEKEILVVGFIIASIATATLSFITLPLFALWTILLFLTRTGASAIEIMTESYFFKLVDGDDADTISFFRALRPLSYLFGPLLGGFALAYIDIQFVFLVPAVILLLGIIPALKIKDTK